MNLFLQKIAEGPLLSDGAMGTLLYAKGVRHEQCLEQLVVSHPDWITTIHQAYATAGADVLKTHTFGANRIRLAKHGLSDNVSEFNRAAVGLARNVCEVAQRPLFVAGDVGPLGSRLQPAGTISNSQAHAAFHEQIAALAEAGVDLLLFETFTDWAALTIGVEAARELSDLPIVASIAHTQNGWPEDAPSPRLSLERLSALGVDLVGVNCGVGPLHVLDALREMHAAAPTMPLSVLPSAGFPEWLEGQLAYPFTPDHFAHHVPLYLEQKARLIGGCCGTTPAHIRALRDALDCQPQARHESAPTASDVSTSAPC